jgi:RyR domain
MQDHPLDIASYIQLNSKKALRRPVITDWYSCVLRTAPSGMVRVVPTTDDEGRPRTVQLVHRKIDKQHCYLVPLTRDLREAEVEPIVRRFALLQPKLDFEVETNETKLVAKDYGEIPLDSAKHVALCMALAKQQHEDWMRERSDAGWRYGIRYNQQAKTHPLLQPWDQLPERHRKPNVNLPQLLLQLLNSHGYAVLHREDLDRLLDRLS